MQLQPRASACERGNPARLIHGRYGTRSWAREAHTHTKDERARQATKLQIAPFNGACFLTPNSEEALAGPPIVHANPNSRAAHVAAPPPPPPSFAQPDKAESVGWN